MSLLMNALKKAEKTKQAGQTDAAAMAPTDSGRNLAQELGLDPPGQRIEGPKTEPTAPGVNAALPGLRPMELALEPELVRESAPPLDAPPIDAPPLESPSTSSRSRPSPEAAQSGARAVFSAKRPVRENSRLPFYSVVGLCLLGGAGYGYYLWAQMQPPTRPPTMAISAAPTPLTAPVAVAAPKTAEPPFAPGGERGVEMAQPSVPASAPLSAPAILGQRNADESDAAARPAEAPVRGKAQPPVPDALAARAPRSRDVVSAVGGAPVQSPANLRITRDSNTAAVNPDVLSGYAALQGGDLDRAGQAYDRALRSEPSNRDALLGAATVLLRLDRTDAAEAYFRQILRLHPNDTYATAQLAALTARADPVGALSQVNSLIARDADRPDSGAGNGALAFVQGNQLAGQGRWPEAQQAYFNAHRIDPGNADYCYNLAVSLDRIHEPRLARDFYVKALELARSRAPGFDVARARVRLDQINGALK